MSYLSDFLDKYGFSATMLIVSLLVACVYVPYAARRADERLDDQIRSQKEGRPSLGDQVLGGVADDIAASGPTNAFQAVAVLVRVGWKVIVKSLHAGFERSSRQREHKSSSHS